MTGSLEGEFPARTAGQRRTAALALAESQVRVDAVAPDVDAVAPGYEDANTGTNAGP